MQIALYKGTSLISRLIRWQTRGEYSHAAVILPDKKIVEAWHKPAKVRLVDSLSAKHTPGTEVDVFSVDVTEQQRASISVYLRRQVGKKYDFLGILRFLSRRKLDNSERWFCSELAFSAFKKAGVDLLSRTSPFEVHPVMLSRSPRLKYEYSMTTV